MGARKHKSRSTRRQNASAMLFGISLFGLSRFAIGLVGILLINSPLLSTKHKLAKGRVNRNTRLHTLILDTMIPIDVGAQRSLVGVLLKADCAECLHRGQGADDGSILVFVAVMSGYMIKFELVM